MLVDPIVAPGEGFAAPGVDSVERRPSLKQNSLARLAADVLGLVLSMVAATITARLLGPVGKGYYASLTLLATLFVHCFSAGLGEAAIVLIGQRRTTLQRAVSASMAAVVPLSLLGAATCLSVGYLVLGADGDGRLTALALAGVLVATMVGYTTEVGLLLSQERVPAVALLAVASGLVTTGAMWIFLGPLEMGVAGGVLASVAGSASVMAAGLVLLARGGLSLRPAWAGDYLRDAARLGIALQWSNLLVAATARLDLVLVYRLDDAASAGAYSVALTVGTLVGSIAVALAYVSFPRLANLAADEAHALMQQVVRIGLTTALFTGLALAAATPLVIPVVFGQDFRSAIAPTLILIPGGVLWSGQWLIARSMAASGATRALMVSFAASFVTMIGLDVALIGAHGEVGAAWAATAASAVGLGVALRYYARQGAVGALIPRPSDVSALWSTARDVVRRLG